jgi:hypothetical protein
MSATPRSHLRWPGTLKAMSYEGLTGNLFVRRSKTAVLRADFEAGVKNERIRGIESFEHAVHQYTS